MKYFKAIIRAIKNVLFLLTLPFISRNDANAILIVNNRFNFKYWIASDPGLKDRLIFKALRSHGFRVKIIFNPDVDDTEFKNLIKDKLVFYNPHHFMFSSSRKFSKYFEQLHRFASVLSDNSYFCHPNKIDIKFWENKQYMHQELDRLSIPSPDTKFLNLGDRFHITNPSIVKTMHSYGSNGIWLIESNGEVDKLLKENNSILLQEFLNISFDIRVICSFGKVVSFYWRINNSNDWKPTATSGGSTVRFFNLPKSVEKLASEIYEKTGCITYGADICFKNDDIGTQPLVLEFSPVYQPNPQSKKSLETINYSNFKNKSLFDYDNEFERINIYIFNDIIQNLLKKDIPNK
tara:strand:+ start:2517 stop:3563 length:1047 start_codon:yes stop_codon:yes gene_type:complete